jgi:hypothetical protein
MPIKFWVSGIIGMNQLLLLAGKLSESGWFLNCIFTAADIVCLQRNVELPPWNDDDRNVDEQVHSRWQVVFLFMYCVLIIHSRLFP